MTLETTSIQALHPNEDKTKRAGGSNKRGQAAVVTLVCPLDAFCDASCHALLLAPHSIAVPPGLLSLACIKKGGQFV